MKGRVETIVAVTATCVTMSSSCIQNSATTNSLLPVASLLAPLIAGSNLQRRMMRGSLFQ